jgi:16S rRNA processing protein RimM
MSAPPAGGDDQPLDRAADQTPDDPTPDDRGPDDRGPDGTGAWLDVARVVRPHGLGGEVVVEPWSDLPERLAPGSVLASDGGPLTVVAARPHQGRLLVTFDGVEGRPAAEALRGRVLRARAVERPGTLWVHELIGAEVVDRAGKVLGVVAAVEASPASDLLVLDRGGLVPLVFVVDHVPGRRVTVDVPEGLLE